MPREREREREREIAIANVRACVHKTYMTSTLLIPRILPLFNEGFNMKLDAIAKSFNIVYPAPPVGNA